MPKIQMKMSPKSISLSFVALLVAVFAALFALAVDAQTTTVSPTSPPRSTTIQLFTVRSMPFNNGNDAMTFQDQVQSITTKLSNAIGNTSTIVLSYNSSSQSQQCWADVQECSQTFTWYFSGSTALENQQLFLSRGYSDADAATILGVEVFRRGTSVPPKTEEEPSIWPFLTLLIAIYGGCSISSVLAMAVAYKIANKK